MGRASESKPPAAKPPEEKPIAPPPLSPELQAVAYSEDQVLAILGIAPATLDRWHARGIAPPKTILPGRNVVYLIGSFNEWLKSREQPVRAPRARRHGAGARA